MVFQTVFNLLIWLPVFLETLLGRELLTTLITVMKQVCQPLVVLLFGSLGGNTIGLDLDQIVVQEAN